MNKLYKLYKLSAFSCQLSEKRLLVIRRRFVTAWAAVMMAGVLGQNVEAGGVAARRQQMSQQVQRQRALAQQQAIAQRQAAIQQQQQAAVQGAQQQAVAQQAQASMEARLQLHGGRLNASAPQEDVKEVVTLHDVLQSLEGSSRAWALIIDQNAKEAVVSEFIERYRRRGVYIGKPAAYYAQMMDGMSQQSSDMLTRPFDQVMRVLAVIEYDFQNGQDKDAMALQVLGTREAVLENKRRLGMR